MLLETSSEKAAVWRLLPGWGSGEASLSHGPQVWWGGRRSLCPHEAQLLPRPDLHPWPLPHLSAIAMETWVMLLSGLWKSSSSL